MVKVSIIIPIYNMENYIEESIKSIQRQTLRDLEIICIDDGSTDHSVMLLQELMAQDDRIRLLFQQHQGAGYARNLGIREAEGEYIAFLDADDYYLDADALQSMYETCVHSKTRVCGSKRKNLQNGELKEASLNIFLQKDTLAGQVLSYRDYQMDYDYQSYLFSRKLLINNEIVFPNYLRYQDPPFMVKVMYAAGKFTYVDKYLYCYRVSNSVKKFNAAKTVDLLCALLDNMQFSMDHHLDILWEKTVERLEYEYASLIVHSMETEHSEILRLLIEANEMVSHKKQDVTYVIRPLRLMVRAASEWDYKTYLKKRLEQADSLVIYGAGMMGRAFLAYLQEENLRDKVKCFLVTSLSDNAETVQGMPVIPLKQYLENAAQNNDMILVALDGFHQKEVESILQENGIKEMELLDTVFLAGLSY